MKPATPITKSVLSSPTAEIVACVPPPTVELDQEEEQLMPYGAAAKAIFVKANGLPAYKKSIRFVRRAN